MSMVKQPVASDKTVQAFARLFNNKKTIAHRDRQARQITLYRVTAVKLDSWRNTHAFNSTGSNWVQVSRIADSALSFGSPNDNSSNRDPPKITSAGYQVPIVCSLLSPRGGARAPAGHGDLWWRLAQVVARRTPAPSKCNVNMITTTASGLPLHRALSDNHGLGLWSPIPTSLIPGKWRVHPACPAAYPKAKRRLNAAFR